MTAKTDSKKIGTAPTGLRAPVTLLSQVREQCEKRDYTLSHVVHEVFQEYVNSESIGVNLTNRAPGLPRDTARELRRLWKDDPNHILDVYLAALNNAGWTLQSLADAVKVTRQAIALRVKKADPAGDEDLPGVPLRSEFTRSKPTMTADERTLFSVRIKPELNESVRDRARREGASVSTILTQGFERFVSGDLLPGDEDVR